MARAIENRRARGLALHAVLCDRWGPQVWHTSPAQAMVTLEELEETARLWLLCAGRVEPLSDASIDDLRRQFGAAW